ncbi:unnamed protein product [Rotaria sp. Silwood1]|nr:unnamed protein product [Rotaria sp. Silwood1]
MNLFKQAIKFQPKIATLNDILMKLNNHYVFHQILFNKNSLYDIFLYEITTTTTTIKQDVYIRCIRGQLTQNDIHIVCTESSKHLLSQINYNILFNHD